ncbi:hypothetical protein ABW19_dt0202057 [Dactylella cylindrospora]|nr:hypothetical protein ABW19_dt0202057 [Dactylella cylindrospora]
MAIAEHENTVATESSSSLGAQFSFAEIPGAPRYLESGGTRQNIRIQSHPGTGDIRGNVAPPADIFRHQHNEINEIQQHHARIAKQTAEKHHEDVHISHPLRPGPPSILGLHVPRPSNQPQRTYNLESGRLTVEPPRGFTIHDRVLTSYFRTAPTITIQDVINSAEMVRDAIERLESALRDYSTNLMLDERAIQRSGKNVHAHEQSIQMEQVRMDVTSTADEHQIQVKKEAFGHQRHFAKHLETLIEDLQKKEFLYQRNLDRLNRQADDPVLSPYAGIPRNREERTEDQEIKYRGRLLIRAKLEKMGYHGGPTQPFLQSLNQDVWRNELKNAILASDHKVLELLSKGAGLHLDLDAIDITDLSTLPWGHFTVAGSPQERDKPAQPGEPVQMETNHLFHLAPEAQTDEYEGQQPTTTTKKGKENSLLQPIASIPRPGSSRGTRPVSSSIASSSHRVIHNSAPSAPTQAFRDPIHEVDEESEDDGFELDRSIIEDEGISPSLKMSLLRKNFRDRQNIRS